MEILQLINFIQDIGFVGLLIVLAVPRLRQFVFGLNGYDKMEKRMEEIHLMLRKEHAATNETLRQHMKDEEIEMKAVHETMANMQADIAFIKGKLEAK